MSAYDTENGLSDFTVGRTQLRQLPSLTGSPTTPHHQPGEIGLRCPHGQKIAKSPTAGDEPSLSTDQVSEQHVEAAQDEAIIAVNLLKIEAERANRAEEHASWLEQQLANLAEKQEQERRTAVAAVVREHAYAREVCEALAEARGLFTVLQEQAELFGSKKDTKLQKMTSKYERCGLVLISPVR